MGAIDSQKHSKVIHDIYNQDKYKSLRNLCCHEYQRLHKCAPFEECPTCIFDLANHKTFLLKIAHIRMET